LAVTPAKPKGKPSTAPGQAKKKKAAAAAAVSSAPPATTVTTPVKGKGKGKKP
jgi:hypothetical protein